MLSGRGIVVRYPGVVALDHVDFDVVAGEVHGLIGENGAGKSTLMKVLSGVARPDEGTIHLIGQSVSLDNPRAASNLGIAMVHQELNLVPHLSVAENIFLGRELVSPLALFAIGNRFADRVNCFRSWTIPSIRKLKFADCELASNK